jgi:CheY-like chemotaxis protein
MQLSFPRVFSDGFEAVSGVRNLAVPKGFEQGPEPRSFSILVIDDNLEDKRLLRLALKWARLPVEVVVRVADDCEAALKAVADGTAPFPNLVLIDLERKGKRCLRALERLKQNEATRAIPVAAWARTGDTELDAAYAAQANCVLQKPETVEQAELMLTRLIRFWSSPFVFVPRNLRAGA